MSTTLRDEQMQLVAHRFAQAFHESRGIITDAGMLRAVAVRAGARIVATDETGADLDEVRELAQATLVEQDFRADAASLFLDDLTLDALALARELRENGTTA